MKTILIIIAILFILFRLFTRTKIYREAIILTDLRKHIDDTSLLKGLYMNTIRSNAAELLMQGKIHDEFYTKLFCGGNITTPWWEVNRKNIVKYNRENAD